LDGNGVIDNRDVDEWLALAATGNGFLSPYRRGDLDLNGLVNESDFGLWNANKFTPSLMWDRGDVNGDGSVDGSDFGLWNANKFTTLQNISAIPEPSAGICWLLAATAFCWRRFCFRRWTAIPSSRGSAR
jgi:hypothetical protein